MPPKWTWRVFALSALAASGSDGRTAVSAFRAAPRLVRLRGGHGHGAARGGEPPTGDGAAVPSRGDGAAETFAFKAEMSQLMSLLINSFYSDKDVFLRELISNAADAIDKARADAPSADDLSAGAPDDLAAAPALTPARPEFEIRLRADPAARSLVVEDNGVGMDRQDLVDFLGTVARSGTRAFVRAAAAVRAAEAAAGGNAAGAARGAELIGQFGVGFYSAFLVAERVLVFSRKRGGPLLAWESDAGGSFTIWRPSAADVRARAGEGCRLASGGVGTAIVLRLRAAEAGYLSEAKLAALVRLHSPFVAPPVRLWARRRRLETDAPAASSAQSAGAADDDAEEGVWDWRPLNALRPLWLREPSGISELEYSDFYKSITGDERPPLTRMHFQADGPSLQLRALLFIPSAASARANAAAGGLKLYIRRVFVCDVGPAPAGALGGGARGGGGGAASGLFLPEWAAAFARGVLDSDSLELNASRERLQVSRAAGRIRAMLVRQILEQLERMSDNRTSPAAFDELYGAYAAQLKLGVHEDEGARDRLLALLRFPSTREGARAADGASAEAIAAAAAATAAGGSSGAFAPSGSAAEDELEALAPAPPPGERPLLASEMTTLQDYVARMPRAQRAIYYLSGDSLRAIRAMPALERVASRGYEVLLLAAPIDEYVLARVQAYKGKPLVSAASDALERFDAADAADAAGAGRAPLLGADVEAASGAPRRSDAAADAGGSAAALAAGPSGPAGGGAGARAATGAQSEMGWERAEEAEEDEEVNSYAAPLCSLVAEALAPRVERVVVSSSLAASPCALVTSAHGWSAGMERILAAHAAARDTPGAAAPGAAAPLLGARKSLELNCRHPIIRALGRRAAADRDDPAVRELALLLYETALLDAGFALQEPAAFSRRIHRVMQLGLGGQPYASS